MISGKLHCTDVSVDVSSWSCVEIVQKGYGETPCASHINVWVNIKLLVFDWGTEENITPSSGNSCSELLIVFLPLGSEWNSTGL